MRVIGEFLSKVAENKLCVYVVGDSVLDEYYSVKVTRIDPASPAHCVMLSSDEEPAEQLPGGAANICYQLKHFNADIRLVSWLDHFSKMVFAQHGVNFQGIILPVNCQIPRKRRFYDGEHQVGDRWDIEKPYCGLDDISVYQQILSEKCKGHPDAIILSDYNKGVFAHNFTNYNHTDAPTIVDPKKGPLCKWKGCTVFKPNAAEAFELSGSKTDWKDQCSYFKKELGCKAVVITQGGSGVVGLAEDFFEYHPTKFSPAGRLIGAGDCFIGVLALAYAHKFPIDQAAIIAFEAGSLYVQTKGSITPWGLQKQSKFVKPCDLRNRNFKLTVANGCYDILHAGHLETLRYAKLTADKLVVAVNSDESVKRLKGPERPVVSLNDRMEMLAALECVDYVVSFEEDTPLEVIKEIQPDYLVKGEDWKGKEVVGAKLVKEVFYVPLVKDKSTTGLVNKLNTL